MRLIDADVLLEKVREIRKLALDRAAETPDYITYPTFLNPAYTRYSTQADEREKFKVMIEEAPTVQPERKAGRQQAETNPLEKCYTCKHVYQRVSDADTLYCRCRKGCKYEEFKPKRGNRNLERHEN